MREKPPRPMPLELDVVRYEHWQCTASPCVALREVGDRRANLDALRGVAKIRWRDPVDAERGQLDLAPASRAVIVARRDQRRVGFEQVEMFVARNDADFDWLACFHVDAGRL